MREFACCGSKKLVRFSVISFVLKMIEVPINILYVEVDGLIFTRRRFRCHLSSPEY